MKRTNVALGVAGAAAVVLLETSAMADPRAGAWTLTWQDEFDCGSVPTAPNPAYWGYETGYVRNKEWQYYTTDPRNAYCQNGQLHVEAHKDTPGTYPPGSYSGQDGSISSASLVSKSVVDRKYGWLEISARIDTRLGSWPAFWTLGRQGEWPDGGECDILEYYQNKLLFNVAWWKTGDRRWTARWDSVSVSLSSLPADWATKFHTWSMEWTPAEVRLYLDGVLKNTWDSSQDSGDRSIQGFQQPHYMIINQAIGGTAGGDASGLTYPTHYDVDWVRWYRDDTNYVDDAASSVTYTGTWTMPTGDLGYRKTEHASAVAGSTATFAFTGDRVWFYGFKRSDLGILEIELDGVGVGTVDEYDAAANYFVGLYASPKLEPGHHTLTVRATGTRNPASSGTRVVVDAFGYTDSGGTGNDPPSFTSDPVIEANASKGQPYAASIADNATDPDASDTLSFSKVSGPAWLSVAANGALAGTPGGADMGLNSFRVAVSDGKGGTAQAGLQITVVPGGKPTR